MLTVSFWCIAFWSEHAKMVLPSTLLVCLSYVSWRKFNGSASEPCLNSSKSTPRTRYFYLLIHMWICCHFPTVPIISFLFIFLSALRTVNTCYPIAKIVLFTHNNMHTPFVHPAYFHLRFPQKQLFPTLVHAALLSRFHFGRAVCTWRIPVRVNLVRQMGEIRGRNSLHIFINSYNTFPDFNFVWLLFVLFFKFTCLNGLLKTYLFKTNTYT